ncbi:MarR family transcriptional regulator [Leifsonia shinshuensis]|uniref:MarR family winged helix-turn-helix transcriptional regulator n=1 Tax=Leifsonia shinshuensis TaxID=150026 RepID=UPI002858C99F|nr:MarR family transcriptional regulator [Leifsonia shinshuensis]MDR6972751.1 DNA-binding MarR family transcriptional regulator [Leifsonia shinshuensis]
MTPARRPARIGFLLTQLGSLAAESFAARARELGITPPEAGAMRILGRGADMNQRELAEKLGVAQSRVVALVDSLEAAGLITRERSTTDRRNFVLHVTDPGRELLARLRSAAEAQEEELTEGLSADDRDRLYELLLRLGDARGLDRDVHPDYRGGSAHTDR